MCEGMGWSEAVLPRSPALMEQRGPSAFFAVLYLSHFPAVFPWQVMDTCAAFRIKVALRDVVSGAGLGLDLVILVIFSSFNDVMTV